MMAKTVKIDTIRETLKILKKTKSTEAFDKLNDKSEEYLLKYLEAVKTLDALQNKPK